MPVSCMAHAERLSMLQHILQHHDAARFLKQHISVDNHVPLCVFAELKYFRGGATLVISLDGLNWLSKRRCKKRYHFDFYYCH